MKQVRLSKTVHLCIGPPALHSASNEATSRLPGATCKKRQRVSSDSYSTGSYANSRRFNEAIGATTVRECLVFRRTAVSRQKITSRKRAAKGTLKNRQLRVRAAGTTVPKAA